MLQEIQLKGYLLRNSGNLEMCVWANYRLERFTILNSWCIVLSVTSYRSNCYWSTPVQTLFLFVTRKLITYWLRSMHFNYWLLFDECVFLCVCVCACVRASTPLSFLYVLFDCLGVWSIRMLHIYQRTINMVDYLFESSVLIYTA